MPRVTDGRRNITHYSLTERDAQISRIPELLGARMDELRDEPYERAGANLGMALRAMEADHAASEEGDTFDFLDTVPQRGKSAAADGFRTIVDNASRESEADGHVRPSQIHSDTGPTGTVGRGDGHQAEAVSPGSTRFPAESEALGVAGDRTSGGTDRLQSRKQFELVTTLAPYRADLDANGVPMVAPRPGPDGCAEYESSGIGVWGWLSSGRVDTLRRDAPAGVRLVLSSGSVIVIEADSDRASFRVWIETEDTVGARLKWILIDWAEDRGPSDEPFAYAIAA